MSVKHTPGPWRAEGWWIGDESHNPVTIATSAIRGETGKANAQLIAAAPEMADALEAVRRQLHVEGRTTLLIDNALKAAGRLV